MAGRGVTVAVWAAIAIVAVAVAAAAAVTVAAAAAVIADQDDKARFERKIRRVCQVHPLGLRLIRVAAAIDATLSLSSLSCRNHRLSARPDL